LYETAFKAHSHHAPRDFRNGFVRSFAFVPFISSRLHLEIRDIDLEGTLSLLRNSEGK